LPVKGSRERALDDGLREAIQPFDTRDWIASSQMLLAIAQQ